MAISSSAHRSRGPRPPPSATSPPPRGSSAAVRVWLVWAPIGQCRYLAQRNNGPTDRPRGERAILAGHSRRQALVSRGEGWWEGGWEGEGCSHPPDAMSARRAWPPAPSPLLVPHPVDHQDPPPLSAPQRGVWDRFATPPMRGGRVRLADAPCGCRHETPAPQLLGRSR